MVVYLRSTNHKERYFISRDQFHSTSNIFCQQWNNIIHRLSNASSHHLLRFFSIQKRYHRLDLIRGSRKITIESDQPGAGRVFFLQKQLTANFAKSYLLDVGQSSEYACLWIIDIPKLPQIKKREK